MNSGNRILRLVTGACLIILLISCGVLAARQGLASLYAYPATSALSLWREGKYHLRMQDWPGIRTGLETALDYDPHNPELLQSMGEVHDAGLAVYGPGAIAARADRDKARQYYQAAVAGRPTWPHGWMALALSKYRLGETDEEFDHARRQAAVLGPWEPGVKYLLADIGLHRWARLDQNEREQVTRIILEGVKDQDTARDLLDLLRRYDMPGLVCNNTSPEVTVAQYCQWYQRR